ncbi:PilZ domain-containing protein [Sphingorhabdus sp. M41]|uniref:PilZ domain-containing protein n=1 Tax=Sphingorhabdus sp. M41 TaxID=1806885 RepID=UPI0012E75118|nr:PilZ domain-containing protein [Sphingorhabdus sp. M41]
MRNSNDWDGLEERDEHDERLVKRAAAKICRQDGPWIPVSVGNISIYGAQVESDTKVEIGEAVSLSVEGLGDFDGVVRWSRHNHFGVRTFDTINVGLFDDRY